jgi:hypothetical protein
MTKLSLTRTLRAAAVALVLGGTAVTGTAMPVQAQSPSVDFEFRFGGPNWHWEFGNNDRHRRHCISDPQVRRDLRRDGYRNIRFFDRRGRIVQVTARLGHRWYEIAYDTCRQRIVDRDRIRRPW